MASEIPIGDPAFDEAFPIVSSKPRLLPSFLDSELRQHLLKNHDIFLSGNLTIRDFHVETGKTYFQFDTDELVLKQMIETAIFVAKKVVAFERS